MYYFTPEVISQANKNIAKLDSKVGGVLCVLHCLTENIEENISYTIDGEKLRKRLSLVFDKDPRDSFEGAKPSFIIFAKDWATTFFSSVIKNKVDLLSCAVFFLRRHGFAKEFTKKEVIDLFITEFNLENYKDFWFFDGNALTLDYNQHNVEDNQSEFYFKMNYGVDFKSILFNGVIQKSATDLKAAGQVQTLYSGSTIQKCFLLSDEPLSQYYIMTNAQHIDADEKEDGNEDEYLRAARSLQEYVSNTGLKMQFSRSEIQLALEQFQEKFSPERLEELDDTQLLSSIFYTCGDNSNALCYWLEHKKEIRIMFGSIAGGSAHKFGLFQRQEDEKWISGSSIKQRVLSYGEALEQGKRIRDALVKGAKIIENETLETVEDYERLDERLREEISSDTVFYNWAWFHKYFSILFPNKLSSFHNDEWQKHILWALRIKPSGKMYARSGQIAMVQKAGGWLYREFFDICYDKFGEIRRFIRLDSSDGTTSYAQEWMQHSIVAMGLSAIGSLEGYLNDEGELNKNKISIELQQEYFSSKPYLTTIRTNELLRFYSSNQNSVFVVTNGERLVGLVDNIGPYKYDNTLETSHTKPGTWHCPFEANEMLPEKTDGLKNSGGVDLKCVVIKNEDNMQFLYDKYYYGSELDSHGIPDGIEGEKKMKTCLEINREARKDKTYPLNLIVYGAPGTGKTYGTAEYALKVVGVPVPDTREKVMDAYNELIRSGQIVFTTFHQSYGYEEFIQGLRPDPKSDKISFKPVDGVFKKIADTALQDLQKNYVIIIDEINRANISKVFGELITLIEEDKRWGEVNKTCVTLQSGDVFAVPNNLYIVGTMNSADKSISLIDAALRRRFIFKEQRPNSELIADQKLKIFFEKLNSYLYDSLGSADLLVGHSYFMGKTIEDLPRILNDSIIPLLYEYFYDNKKYVNKALEDTLGKVDYVVVDDKTGRIYVVEKE